MPTILITGSSSGFGHHLARHFLARDWNVIATMRTPKENILQPSSRLRVLALDVTSDVRIRATVDAAGPIDVLVNNAGIGLMGAFEPTPMATVREIFDTNLFGAMAVTQAVIPGMRARHAGVIVNVSSAVTYAPLPLLAVYTASKAAVDAFTASLALELAPHGIRAHTVLPGRAPETSFGTKAKQRMEGLLTPAYEGFAKGVFASMMAQTAEPPIVTRAEDVSAAIWKAATDPASPARMPAGADAVALAGRVTA